MNRNIFNILGWLLLLGIGISWIVYGYSEWYLLILPLAYLAFSINDNRLKKLNIIKQMSIQQILLILFSFALSVAIVFGLIQAANYLINDFLYLTGSIKTFSIIVAVIVSLYPVQFTFGSVVEKIIVNAKQKN